MQRIEYATLELARAAGLHVSGTRMESVGKAEALLLLRFDREWDPPANAYARHGLVSGLTVLDAGDGYSGRDRWSYLLPADEIRCWSVKPDADRLDLFRRMVFYAMVTNNDDHPRNHTMLRTPGGWRLSPALPVRGWRCWFLKHQVENRSVEHFSGAFLPECFFRQEPIPAP